MTQHLNTICTQHVSAWERMLSNFHETSVASIISGETNRVVSKSSNQATFVRIIHDLFAIARLETWLSMNPIDFLVDEHKLFMDYIEPTFTRHFQVEICLELTGRYDASRDILVAFFV